MRLRPRYEAIDLRMQRLQIGLQSVQPAWLWDITANWAEVAVGKTTVIRIRAEGSEGTYSTYVPLSRLLDEQVATIVESIMLAIDGLRTRGGHDTSGSIPGSPCGHV